VLLLIKKESKRFERSKSDAWKKEVWNKEKPLTPRGMTVMKDIFEKCDTSLFPIHVSKKTTDHTATICKKSSPQRDIQWLSPRKGRFMDHNLAHAPVVIQRKRAFRATTW
jgi:hypothetical protein